MSTMIDSEITASILSVIHRYDYSPARLRVIASTNTGEDVKRAYFKYADELADAADSATFRKMNEETKKYWDNPPVMTEDNRSKQYKD